ncbi:hypothetical protein DERF_012217 [Dermatophagoides farinae]|uniref:Kinesin motor domain-containing protein n=1 Tax=Dermatophagoides farinae TaxID=6954 RepID=A0A922L392_DERFA|nr:hypothetical protein DERF_012217 [Dermatophagoides farinae]
MACTFNTTSMMESQQDSTYDSSSENIIQKNLTFNKCDSSNSIVHDETFDESICNEQIIKTFLRIRSDVEIDSRYKIIDNNLSIDKNLKTTDEYRFDKIFYQEYSQYDVFKVCTLPLLKEFIVGKNSLIFTFGVTSSGKTFTMKGNVKNPGIIPYSLVILFQMFAEAMEIKLPTYKPICFSDRKRLTKNDQNYEDEIRKYIVHDSMGKNDGKNFQITENLIYNNHLDLIEQLQKMFKSMSKEKQEVCIWISYFEIYNDTIIDLLNVRYKDEMEPKIMFIKDNKEQYYVNGIRQVFVESATDAYMVYLFGQNNLKKHMAQTALNPSSSRSHSIFKITLIRIDHSTAETFTSNINFCDLAGAERIAKTGNVGNRAKETNKINQSLCLLNQCISSLTGKKDHQNIISFRSSKLTHVLQPYLFSNGGSFSTIINLNPSTKLFDESIYSLNFCDNIKAVPISQMPSYKRRMTMAFSHNLEDVDEDSESEEMEDDDEENESEIINNIKNPCNCDKLKKEKLLLAKEIEECRQEYNELIDELRDQMNEQNENHEDDLKRNDKLWLMRIDCIQDKYHTELDTKIAKIELLENQLFDVQSELVESQQIQSELIKAIKNCEDQFDRKMKKIDIELKQYELIYGQKLEKINGYFKLSVKESAKTRQIIQELRTTNEANESENKSLQKENELLKDKLRTTNEANESENKSLQKENELLKNKLRTTIEANESENKSLQKENELLKNKLSKIVKANESENKSLITIFDKNASLEYKSSTIVKEQESEKKILRQVNENLNNESELLKKSYDAGTFSDKKKKRAAIQQQMSSTTKKLKLTKQDISSPSDLISPDTMLSEFKSEQKCTQSNNAYNTRSKNNAYNTRNKNRRKLF